ncbi:MAG: hypothetical protein M3P91_12390 [Actinomycetota bacterium]|nr:hypothetical protein [Actinomycetota bacterium]
MALPVALDVESGLNNAWASTATFVPKLLLFLVIVAISFLVAKVLAKAVNAILERLGFDRAVERGGIKQALAKSKYDASDIVAKLAYYAVLLIGLTLAFDVFGPNAISAYLAAMVAYLPRIFVALVIVVFAAAAAKVVKDLLGNMLGGLGYGNILATVASGLILGIGVFAALSQLQIAPQIVHDTYRAILVALVGVTVVGVGGGLIRPMQSRLERALNRVEDEAPRARRQVQESTSATDSFSTPQGDPAYPAEGYLAGQYDDAPTQAYQVPRTDGGSIRQL